MNGMMRSSDSDGDSDFSQNTGKEFHLQKTRAKREGGGISPGQEASPRI